MKRYNEWLCEQEGGVTLENVTLILNGNQLMVECEGGNSFDLELDEEQAADLGEKMQGCADAGGGEEGEEGGEEGMEDQGPEGMDDQGPPPQQMGGGGFGESKIFGGKKCCPKCKSPKCRCSKKKCSM